MPGIVTVTLRTEFDAAHRLPEYVGKCRNLHGHRYTLEVEVTGKSLQQSGPCAGMLLDFVVLKQLVRDYCTQLDHAALLMQNDPLVLALEEQNLRVVRCSKPPTAEVLVEMIATELDLVLPLGVVLQRVRLYETANCWAEWRPQLRGVFPLREES